MVELVRDVRSSLGYIDGEFKTFCIDVGSREFEVFSSTQEHYNYVFNLSAMKHVRSEKDPYSLVRMIRTNVFNTIQSIDALNSSSLKKYFCVSTDKATAPVNLMGASKRIMELALFLKRDSVKISTARFANVAFSDGSLLEGFQRRLLSKQPLSAPRNIRRYFLTSQEAAELCLLSCFTAKGQQIYFPKINEKIKPIKFSEVAINVLRANGLKPHICETEVDARAFDFESNLKNIWPCFFFDSDTTGEKEIETFFEDTDKLISSDFEEIEVMENSSSVGDHDIRNFLQELDEYINKARWEKSEIVDLFGRVLSNFQHNETGKHLDDKM